MTTQVNSTSSPAIWKRIVRVLQGEGLRGVIDRIQDRRKTNFAYLGGYLVACPIESNESQPKNTVGLQVDLVKKKDPGILAEIYQVYGPPYSEDLILARWEQQRLLCFLGRVNGEAVGCVWVNPEGAVSEFSKEIFRLAPDEAYYKDAWVKPEWRGKNIYPVMKVVSGQMLREQYGKKTALSFIRSTNHASLNASRKLGGRRQGRITYLKVFRRKFAWLTRSRPRAL